MLDTPLSARRVAFLKEAGRAPDVVRAVLIEASRLNEARADRAATGPRTDRSEPRLPKRRVIELVEAGLPGKAIARLEAHKHGGVLELTDDVKQQVIQLHPVSDRGLPAADAAPLQPPNAVTPAELEDILESTTRLSASGLSAWTYDLVRVVVANDEAKAVASELLTLMIQGRLQVPRAWLMSRLILLPKNKDGRVRPLAVGECWCRLASRILSKRLVAAASAHLAPLQYGIGVKGGVEIAAHLIQLAARVALDEDQDFVVQTVDFANAFNCVSRDAIHQQVVQHLPQLSAYFRWAYAVLREHARSRRHLRSQAG